MRGEKYILDCPQCGQVEAYLPADEQDYDAGPGEWDSQLEDDTFDSEGGPVDRVRCPNCGQWSPADLARPA